MRYKFDKENHVHLLDDKPLHGVTTVLRVISKPALINWSANMAVDYIQENLPSAEEAQDNHTIWESLFKEARKAHRTKRDKAGDWGTIVHDFIEQWIKEGVEPKDLEENQQKVFDEFKKWSTENKVKFIESEKHVYSEKLWTGGILDLVFEMDGKRYIGDIKTSSGIYDEAFFQMAAYHLMLLDMGEGDDIHGYLVINLKKDGTMDMKRADNLKINQEAFLHALGLHKILNKIK